MERPPPLWRIAEVAAYSLLNFLPFVILALYPFHDQLRFSLRATGGLLAAMVAVQLGLGQIAASGLVNAGLLSVTSTALYLAFYFVAVRAPLGKMLFTLFMLSNVANLVTTDAKCFEGLVFGQEMALQSYRWTFSVCMLVLEAAVLALLAWYFNRFYAPCIVKRSSETMWNYLWLIPATFYVVWFWYHYGSDKTSLKLALDPASALFVLVINLGAFLVYHTVIILINEMDKNAQLTERNHQLAIQALQYENLTNQIDEARRARHDVRHHVAVLEHYLNTENYEALGAYLQGYRESLPEEAPLMYCRNAAANALLGHFAQQAQAAGMRFNAQASLPEHIGVPDEEITVLLGNLLENAIEACERVLERGGDAADPPSVEVSVKLEHDALFVLVENSCRADRTLVSTRQGRYLSTKHLGEGIGLESARSIAERYDGVFEAQQEGNHFRASALLNIPST